MWQLIDSRTIVLACAVAGMALSLVTYLIWRAGVTCPGFGRWTAAVALTVISSWLVGLRGVVPDWLSIVAGNFCSVASLILYGEGLHQFHGRRRSPWMFWLAGLFAASLAYFRYVQDSLAIRVFLTAATLGGGALFYALPLTRTAFRGRSAGARVVVIALWWLVLGSTFRLLGILRNPGQTDLYSTNTAGLLGLVLYLVVAPCLPIGCVLAAYERLVAELRETNANMLLISHPARQPAHGLETFGAGQAALDVVPLLRFLTSTT